MCQPQVEGLEVLLPLHRLRLVSVSNPASIALEKARFGSSGGVGSIARSASNRAKSEKLKCWCEQTVK